MYHIINKGVVKTSTLETIISKVTGKKNNEIKEEICAVRGNCDTEVDQMVLEFPILADYCYLNLAGDPEEKNSDVTIFATHGHVYNPHKLPMLKDGDILLNGHTHIPACEEILDMNGGNIST